MQHLNFHHVQALHNWQLKLHTELLFSSHWLWLLKHWLPHSKHTMRSLISRCHLLSWMSRIVTHLWRHKLPLLLPAGILNTNKVFEFSFQWTSSFFYLIPRYLLQEAAEAVNWSVHWTAAEVTPWAGEEFQCSFTQILNSHRRPNPDDEIWTLTAPCCWRQQPYTELVEHTHTHTLCRVRLTQLTWRPHGTWIYVWREKKRKKNGAFQLEGFKGEVRI